MASRHRLESLHRCAPARAPNSSPLNSGCPISFCRLSTRLTEEISAHSASSTPARSPYASPRDNSPTSRAFFTPPLTPSSPAAAGWLTEPPASVAPRPGSAGLARDNGKAGDGVEERLQRLEDQQAHQAKRLADVEAHVRDSVRSLQQKVTDALFQSQSQIDEHRAGLQTRLDQLERKLHEVDDDQTKRTMEHHTFFTNSLRDSREHLAKELEAVNASFAGLEARTRTGFERAEAELAATSKELSGTLAQEVARLDTSTDTMNDKFVDICIGLDNKAVRLDDSARERMSSAEAHTTQQLADIADELTRSCAALEAATDKKLADSRATTDGQLGKVAGRVERVADDLGTARAEQQTALDAEVAEMGNRLETASGGLRERMDALKAEVEAELTARVAEALTKTEYKTAKMLTEMKLQELEDAVKETHGALGGMEGKVEACEETCSELTIDLMQIETALEAAA